ncbi:poly(A) polymerase [Candidatus Nanopelagicus hibericus]|uniref:Poly(A) polymerase n=1 Tax=Candidatus Nanopelagicus hibericus TaxID=1884915 RepID=A0A249KAN9_9ACTN|nr:CCA tRNA nucleotidyltransferase [Candidatus Nanopelagicus hibericus]ASY13873.1 poly(A) polymerase [Candidatus Nanopelagicus hibericus]
MKPPITAAAQLAITTLTKQAPAAKELAQLFKQAGFQLALVGGPVRDAILGRLGNDLDFTTDAHPKECEKILKKWADSVWDIGAAFGTVAGKKAEITVEITTYRSESYSPDSRKPNVEFGKTIEGDLARRDFTINAMALELTTTEPLFIDPYNGVGDLQNQIIKTPGEAKDSFTDDPLRMMRAARFMSQLNFTPEISLVAAIKSMASRLEIISAERIRDEFIKLIMGDNPRAGLSLLVESGLADYFLPELPKLKLEIDEHHHHKDVYEHSLTVLEQAIALEARLGGANLTLRLAALLHDIGKPKTKALLPDGGVSFHHHEVVGARMCKERMKKLRFDNHIINDVSQLVSLHLRFHGYGNGEWTDSAVRRYVRDAGELLTHLHLLTRADCTTRNKKKAEGLAKTYDQLEDRIAQLMEQEELDKIRPDLSGDEIMKILDIKPSPAVGKAYEFLLELRLEHGPLGQERAKKELVNWWQKQN